MEDPHRDPPDVLLESHTEYRKRWRSLYVIYFTTFLMALGFGIVLTGVWPYLDKVTDQRAKDDHSANDTHLKSRTVGP